MGSKSPRRHYLMKETGFDFEVETGNDVEEKYPQDIDKEHIPIYLSELKAKAFDGKIKADDILITADTIVLLKGEVVEKPSGEDEAKMFLHALSGNKHTVVTGVTLTSLKKQHSFSAKTDVYFDQLTSEEIDYYVRRFQPLDKAGAYGIQEWIGYIGVEKIEGSYFNVMGLPVQHLYKELGSFLDDSI